MMFFQELKEHQGNRKTVCEVVYGKFRFFPPGFVMCKCVVGHTCLWEIKVCLLGNNWMLHIIYLQVILHETVVTGDWEGLDLATSSAEA